MIYEEIISHLDSNGVPEAGVWWGYTPPTPDEAVVVHEYKGPPPTRTKAGIVWEYPRFQVTTRAKTFVEAMEMAEAVYAALGDFAGGTLAGAFYDYIRANDRPFLHPGGLDDGGRTRVLCNFRGKRRPT